MNEPRLIQCAIAETIGTFCLVFAGCGAIVVNSLTGGAVGHVGVSAVFGLVVTAMIYSVGNISGAHLNPAVTVGFWLARRMKLRTVAAYILSQCVGAVLAAVALAMMFPQAKTLGQTAPAGWAGPTAAFAMEVILTFILMFVILNVSTGHMEKGIMAGVAVGGTIALEALLGGPASGASMNPARSLGPAVVAGDLNYLWIYLSAPLLGAIIAHPSCRIIQAGQCCAQTDPSETANDC